MVGPPVLFSLFFKKKMLLQIFRYSYNHHLNNDNPQVTQHIQIGIMSNSSSMGLRHDTSQAHWYVFYMIFSLL